MSKEVAKLFDEITNDDLIEGFENSIGQKSVFRIRWNKEVHLVSIRKWMFSIIMVVLLVIVVIGVSNKVDDNAAVNKATGLDVKVGGDIEEKLRTEEKKGDINAEAFANVDSFQFDTLTKKINDEVDYRQIVEDIERLIESGAEGFLLCDTEGLGISKYNLTMINVDSVSVSNVAYEFLFSNSEPVGYVMFYGVNDEVSYSISLNTADTYGYYLDFLDNHREESFVILTDGFKGYFLSEDNVLYSASTGNVVDKIRVEGDCYQALNGNEISVSYEKIVDEIEVIQK